MWTYKSMTKILNLIRKKIGVFEIKNEITSEQCKLFTKMAE